MVLRSSRITWSLLFFAVFLPHVAFSQDDGTVLRCTAYCGQDKLHLANAQLTWASKPAGAAQATPVGLDVTVERNGFNAEAFATFQSTEIGNTPILTFEIPPAATEAARAYRLRIIKAPPKMENAFVSDDGSLNEPKDQGSLVIEDLESGLRYTWRLRFKIGSEVRFSPQATCVAPTCPADMRE